MEEKNFVCILFISKYNIGQHQQVLFLKSVDAYWYSKWIFYFPQTFCHKKF